MGRDPNVEPTEQERNDLIAELETLFGSTLAPGMRQAILNANNWRGIGIALTAQLKEATKPIGGQGGPPQ